MRSVAALNGECDGQRDLMNREILIWINELEAQQISPTDRLLTALYAVARNMAKRKAKYYGLSH